MKENLDITNPNFNDNNKTNIIGRASLKEEFKDLPLVDIETKHLKEVDPDKVYMFIDGEEYWHIKFLSAEEELINANIN